jgi:hypothetical protein
MTSRDVSSVEDEYRCTESVSSSRNDAAQLPCSTTAGTEDGCEASRSTCSVTALYKLDGGRDDKHGIRTVEGKRLGEKWRSLGMGREWIEDLSEDYYEREIEIEEARTCLRCRGETPCWWFS